MKRLEGKYLFACYVALGCFSGIVFIVGLALLGNMLAR